MESPHSHPPSHSPKDPSAANHQPRSGSPWILWLIIIGFVAFVIFTFVRRAEADREVKKTTDEMAEQTVSTLAPQQSPQSVTLDLPATVSPFENTSVYARTNGYIKTWDVDIGTHVKAGQLLLELEAPDLDQQIDQAKATVAQNEATVALAKLTADRWAKLLKEKTVSQQESDEKSGAYTASVAALNAAKASLGRLQKLKDFQKVTAPFDGTITMRNVNVGDLVNSSGGTGTSGSSATELFQIQKDDVLRVFITVPETVASDIKVGDSANVELASAPGKNVKAKVARTAEAIDPASRTLLVELDIDNANRQLLAGGYATVHMPIHIEHPTLVLPVNTLLFRPGGTEVGVVKNGEIEMKKIKIGRDYGTQVEIVSGLEKDDQVVLNPSDSLARGDKVRVNNDAQKKKANSMQP